jgi:hypothetical protein
MVQRYKATKVQKAVCRGPKNTLFGPCVHMFIFCYLANSALSGSWCKRLSHRGRQLLTLEF